MFKGCRRPTKDQIKIKIKRMNAKGAKEERRKRRNAKEAIHLPGLVAYFQPQRSIEINAALFAFLRVLRCSSRPSRTFF